MSALVLVVEAGASLVVDAAASVGAAVVVVVLLGYPTDVTGLPLRSTTISHILAAAGRTSPGEEETERLAALKL